MAQQKRGVFSANFEDDSDSEEPEYSKIRLVYTDPTDELRNEVTSLRAQLLHVTSHQNSVAQAKSNAEKLSLKLTIAKSQLETKNVLIHEYKKRLNLTLGQFDSEVSSAVAGVIHNLKQVLVCLNTERTIKSQKSLEKEEDNSFLTSWSIRLLNEIQDLDHMYSELRKDYEQVRIEFIQAQESVLACIQTTEPDRHHHTLHQDVGDANLQFYQKYIVKLPELIRECPESSADVSSWFAWLEYFKDVKIKALTEINSRTERSSNVIVLKPGDIKAIKSILLLLLEDGQEQKSEKLQRVYEYEEVHALKPQKLLLNEKNKQLELVQERSLEIRRQDEDEAYQAKNNKIEKEIVAIRQKVHKLQLEKEELQSMLQVGEASSSNKLQNAMQEMKTQQEQQACFFEAQILALNRQRDLLEASLKQAWECKNSELKRNCEEFDSLKKEVEALETILGEKDQQLQSNEQHRLEIDSALQSYQSLEQVRATRYRELVKELTAAKQEVHLRQYSPQARLQEQQKAYQSFDARLNDMSRRKDLLEISLKEAWECKNQELEDSQRGCSILQEKIQTVQTILNQKEIQIQENELEISRLNASLQRKEEENDYEDSIETDHQMQVERLREDIKYLEDAVEQLEASRDSLEADLQSEEVKVRDREASLLQKEADHAIICKSLEDRLSAFRRDNQTKVSKTLLTDLQHAYELESTQLKDTQQKLIRANKKNVKVKDHIAGIEQKVAESQAQGEEMQRQIMQLEYELAQRRTQSKDIHSTVSILQDENLAKALRIKELLDLLEYHKIDHHSTLTGTSSTMQADQFRVSSSSSRATQLQLEPHTTIGAPSLALGQFAHSTASVTYQPSSSSSRNLLPISSPSVSTEMRSPMRSVPSTGEASIPLMQGIHFGGLNKSLRKAAVAAELRMTTKREYVLRPSKEMKPSSQLATSKLRHRNSLSRQHRKPSIYSKQSRVHMESEEEQDSDEENGKEY
ncbi:hypothetical protein C8R41DRAFT_917433 [Lentinula lateritia]|uniref:Uncharacterized protein n=1 Tax=Lentinula lateritia TaxID=40482 RepID=A0ABQ8VLY6_9AGAR|nr:hypothetical protein C8R41DRAFT_917433 [Lentinula lateritia]